MPEALVMEPPSAARPPNCFGFPRLSSCRSVTPRFMSSPRDWISLGLWKLPGQFSLGMKSCGPAAFILSFTVLAS